MDDETRGDTIVTVGEAGAVAALVVEVKEVVTATGLRGLDTAAGGGADVGAEEAAGCALARTEATGGGLECAVGMPVTTAEADVEAPAATVDVAGGGGGGVIPAEAVEAVAEANEEVGAKRSLVDTVAGLSVVANAEADGALPAGVPSPPNRRAAVAEAGAKGPATVRLSPSAPSLAGSAGDRERSAGLLGRLAGCL